MVLEPEHPTPPSATPDRSASLPGGSPPTTRGDDNDPGKAQLLIVDDDPLVRRILATRLPMAGYEVAIAEDGKQAVELFEASPPDLVVLDIMLPKLDGFAVCRRLRAESNVPIIFLSALHSTNERIAGLELGADDYLPKPFSPRELEMRIAAILNRQTSTSVIPISAPPGTPNHHGIIKTTNLVIDTIRRQVTRNGLRLNLTYTEFSLLELLFQEPGEVVPRTTILEKLWGYPAQSAANLRVVDVYVARLRSKLELDPRNPELILTVRGTGYAAQGRTSVCCTTHN